MDNLSTIGLNNIIEGCIKNDGRQQELLYRTYSRAMFGICIRYAANYREAEDILQTGFIKVFSKIATYKNEGPFFAWLRKIMINTAIEHYRKSRRRIQTDEIEKYSSLILQQSNSSLDVKDLLKLIQQLPGMYRKAFVLHAIEGYSHKEISELLGISEVASRANLCRAREILKKIILKTETEERERLAC